MDLDSRSLIQKIGLLASEVALNGYSIYISLGKGMVFTFCNGVTKTA